MNSDVMNKLNELFSRNFYEEGRNELLRSLDEGTIKVYDRIWNDFLIEKVESKLRGITPQNIDTEMEAPFDLIRTIRTTSNTEYNIAYGTYFVNEKDYYGVDFNLKKLVNMFKKDNIDIEFAIKNYYDENSADDYSEKIPTTYEKNYRVKFTTSLSRLKEVLGNKTESNSPTPKERILNK